MQSSSSRESGTRYPQQYGLHGLPSIARQTPPSVAGMPYRKAPYSTPQARPPLVLDAAASSHSAVSLISVDSNSVTTPYSTQSSSSWSTSNNKSKKNGTLTMRKRLLGQRVIETPVVEAPQEPVVSNEHTAAAAAKDAPRAGYLQKLGANVPEFKRRFFVLQPGTHLYYFLSPNDTTPRGCLDLDQSWMEPIGELPDGRFRFAVCWQDRKVLLEARSRQIGEEWMESLQTERLSYCQEALEKAQHTAAVQASQIAELEKQVNHFRWVEKDRDGALEDAAHWRREFEHLDESIRRLTKYLRKPPGDDNNDRGIETKDENKASQTEGKDGDADRKSPADSVKTESLDDGPVGDASRDTSLLDDAMEREGVLDAANVPGAHFSALYNACEQLRENARLVAEEASTAVEDLTAANAKVEAVEKRMGKAENHLCKLWEENCAVRKALKQKKREKRVLVREVKSLREAAHNTVDDHSSNGMPPDDASSALAESDEEKLINELAEHVESSIRLHERLVTAKGGSAHANDASASNPRGNVGQYGATVKIDANNHRPPPDFSGKGGDNHEPNRPLLSLFDDDSVDTESEVEDDANSFALSRSSSLLVESSDVEQSGVLDVGIVIDTSREDDDISRDRTNPLDDLDAEDDDETPQMCATSSQSESSKSAVITNGQATSKLSCPLTDVVDTHQGRTRDGSIVDTNTNQVYHLTFYSRKIGLQFQKVPPPKPQGLLTEAMTSDLDRVPTDGDHTAAELRRIAAFSSSVHASIGDKKFDDTLCKVATPVDAVLVCGFNGFDDSASNVRPKLGARLVAFDGASVEVGRWTFESIRKAIQSRGRPLTLSFRNDFLTTEQRTILTKAARDVNAVIHPALRVPEVSSQQQPRPPSTEPSVRSALSHETDHFVNDQTHEDDLSSAGGEHRQPLTFSASRSTTSSSFGGYTPGTFRSFSEAGSSASVMSAVAPLVANLLGKREPFTPEYLRRESASVEDTPQHQDFKADLL